MAKNGVGGADVRKSGGKTDEIAMSPNPVSPIFPEAADLPTSSLYRTKYRVSGWENGGNRKYPLGIRKSGDPGGLLYQQLLVPDRPGRERPPDPPVRGWTGMH